jgi:hypothetical protein
MRKTIVSQRTEGTDAMTQFDWPLAHVGNLRGFKIYVRCGQGTRRPRDGFFAYSEVHKLTLRAPYRYAIEVKIRELWHHTTRGA